MSTPRRKRRKKPKQKPAAGVPACPEHLDEAAKVEWRRIVRELKAIGGLSKTDRAALAVYCQTWSRWQAAEIALREQGTIVKSPNGWPMKNPHLLVAEKALGDLRKSIEQLGLSAWRARVKRPSRETTPPTATMPETPAVPVEQCAATVQDAEDPLAGLRLRRADDADPLDGLKLCS